MKGIPRGLWKTFIVVPFFRAGDLSLVDNYCRVLLLGGFGRVSKMVRHNGISRYLGKTRLNFPARFSEEKVHREKFVLFSKLLFNQT